MDHQQIREIAEAAFKAHFGHIGILSINVEPGIDFGDDFPVVEVRIIYDAKMEEVLNGHTMAVRREIMDNFWREEGNTAIWPQVHFIAKSDIGRQDPATV